MREKDKIYGHVISKYANHEGNHQATTFKYPARLKTQTQAWSEKFNIFLGKYIVPIAFKALEKELVAKLVTLEVVTSLNLFTKNLKQPSSKLSPLENDMFENPR